MNVLERSLARLYLFWGAWSLNSTHSDTTLLRPCDREFKTKIVSYHMRHLKFGQAIYIGPPSPFHLTIAPV